MPERCASQSLICRLSVSLLGSLLLMSLVELCRVFQKRKLKTGICSEQLRSDRSLYCVQHKPLFPAVLCGFPSFPSFTAQQIHTPTVAVAFCILQELIIPPHSHIHVVYFSYSRLLTFCFCYSLFTFFMPPNGSKAILSILISVEVIHNLND